MDVTCVSCGQKGKNAQWCGHCKKYVCGKCLTKISECKLNFAHDDGVKQHTTQEEEEIEVNEESGTELRVDILQ